MYEIPCYSAIIMSSSLRVRKVFRNFVVTTLFSAWTKSNVVRTVVRKCARDQYVLEVFHRFRQAFFKPKRSLLFSVTAAYKSNDDDKTDDFGIIQACDKNITDLEMQALLNELANVEELARRTMYCPGCARRVQFDKKTSGTLLCQCKDVEPPEESYDGWMPYMEADDVIIWRKEYKPGQGLFAYKVYGRYNEVRAEDFAAIQIDGAYRREWDNAVAALSVVERQANGVAEQSVLHWEVMWPRLFANRDYVYIRRHKEYDVKSKCLRHKEGLFNETDDPCKEDDVKEQNIKKMEHTIKTETERPNVHSNAKRKSQELARQEREKRIEYEKRKKNEEKQQLQKEQPDKQQLQNQQLQNQKDIKQNFIEVEQDDKIYVIVSKSCIHPQVPETRNAIRVSEYWSHMVVKTLEGPEKHGCEFVLTYYDEPAVGGLPSVISSFATARGAPAFLTKMREAATNYKDWREKNHQDAPDFRPFGPETVSYEDRRTLGALREQEMESSKSGPDLENNSKPADTKEQSTQTETETQVTPKTSPPPDIDKILHTSYVKQNGDAPSIHLETPEQKPKDPDSEGDDDNEERDKSEGWFRNIYPFYYFV